MHHKKFLDLTTKAERRAEAFAITDAANGVFNFTFDRATDIISLEVREDLTKSQAKTLFGKLAEVYMQSWIDDVIEEAKRERPARRDRPAAEAGRNEAFTLTIGD